jgi:FKBP-type peptidyl-prolyl cis-trans isomerase SlyD
MALQKKDFIQIDFTGRVKDTNEVFDSNIKKDLEKAGLENQEAKPFTFSLEEGMFLKGIDEFLIGKEIGKYTIELEPEKAFGKRDPKLIHLVPMKVFREQKMNPVAGAMLNIDGRIAKILSVSGGRVMVDFNNPIAGKTVVYDLNVMKKVEDLNEKIKSMIYFLFKKDFKFEIKDKKIILDVEPQLAQFVAMFEKKFQDVFGMSIQAKEAATKPTEKSQ